MFFFYLFVFYCFFKTISIKLIIILLNVRLKQENSQLFQSSIISFTQTKRMKYWLIIRSDMQQYYTDYIS